MPHETKAQAIKRAKKLGIPISHVVKADDDGYFIAPFAVKSAKAKKAYANCRAKNGEKSTCAAVSTNLQKKNKGGKK